MKLSIGKNIKIFRKLKDITQEQLSEMLGVSCQSVSRWESDICYPDMELLPALAEIFDITVDKLLGVDSASEKKKVDEYLNLFQISISEGRINDCISIARKGVSEFPNNYSLLNKLMYALFVSGDDTGNIQEWKENMNKYDSEIISLGERIIKNCPDQDIKLEATARLAFQHCEMGRKNIGRKLFETLPSQELTRENQIWWALEDNEKLQFIRNKIHKDYAGLKSDIWLLATCGKLTTEDSILAIKKIEMLSDIICDKNQASIDTWLDARINFDLAKLYAKLKNKELTLKHLKLSAKNAIKFDNRAEEQSYSSVLLGKVTIKKTYFETADSRPLNKIMRDKWLKDSEFNLVRDTKEFEKIVDML